jgi:V8-like Glu-specific endopeptidase
MVSSNKILSEASIIESCYHVVSIMNVRGDYLMFTSSLNQLGGLLILVLLISCGKSSNPSTQTGSDTTSPPTDSDKNQNTIPHDCSFSELDSLQLSAIYNSKGEKLPDSSVNSSEIAWTILNPSQHPSFNGLGRYSNCSGTLLETNSSNSDAPAYVLTNGHCVGSSLLGAEEVVLDRAEAAGKKMMLAYYNANVLGTSYTTVSARTIAFASMNQTDAAIVELNSTLAQLKTQGFCAYSLAADRPAKGTQVFIAGVPLSGVNSSKLGLHFASCSIGETVSLWEGDYRFLDSFRHRCSIMGGNSGSAIFDRHSKKIVGVVNTAVNDNAITQSDCSLNKPCEKDASGASSTNAEENYGQYVNYLAGCFNENGIFDATLSSCGITAKFGLRSAP